MPELAGAKIVAGIGRRDCRPLVEEASSLGPVDLFRDLGVTNRAPFAGATVIATYAGTRNAFPLRGGESLPRWPEPRTAAGARGERATAGVAVRHSTSTGSMSMIMRTPRFPALAS